MQRVRIAGLAAVIAALHVIGFGALGAGAVGAGLGLTAYALGLRHAFDADHIAAIDGTTRKLMAEGPPRSGVRPSHRRRAPAVADVSARRALRAGLRHGHGGRPADPRGRRRLERARGLGRARAARALRRRHDALRHARRRVHDPRLRLGARPAGAPPLLQPRPHRAVGRRRAAGRRRRAGRPGVARRRRHRPQRDRLRRRRALRPDLGRRARRLAPRPPRGAPGRADGLGFMTPSPTPIPTPGRSTMRRVHGLVGALVAALAAGAIVVAVGLGSSHREAPLTSLDPTGDDTDVYAFTAKDAPGALTVVANWIPFEDPAGGPNFYRFDDRAHYYINVDNTGDGAWDVRYLFTFHTKIGNTSTFLYAVPGVQSISDPKLNVKQFYDVTRLRYRNGRAVSAKVVGHNLPVAPNNVGPKTIPDYDKVANEAIRSVTGGGKVFAGQRDDPFFV